MGHSANAFSSWFFHEMRLRLAAAQQLVSRFFMTDRVERSGLQVDAGLATFIEQDVLSPLGIEQGQFWAGFAAICNEFVPRNRALLAKRDAIQEKIDAWHLGRAGQPHDPAAYRAFLQEIGYLVPEPGDFAIGTRNVDAEIATMAGPQLVVPVLNERFALNAANARWGSLYDAFYGTDTLDAAPARPGMTLIVARRSSPAPRLSSIRQCRWPLAAGPIWPMLKAGSR
jgi:malate synthase